MKKRSFFLFFLALLCPFSSLFYLSFSLFLAFCLVFWKRGRHWELHPTYGKDREREREGIKHYGWTTHSGNHHTATPFYCIEKENKKSYNPGQWHKHCGLWVTGQSNTNTKKKEKHKEKNLIKNGNKNIKIYLKKIIFLGLFRIIWIHRICNVFRDKQTHPSFPLSSLLPLQSPTGCFLHNFILFFSYSKVQCTFYFVILW